MKYTRTTAFLLTFTLCGCHFFGPRDTTGLTPITGIDQLNNLPGTWTATNNTYNLMKRLEYPADSIRIILHKDSSFEAVNIPDCLSDPFGNPVNHKLLNASGEWRPEKIGKQWKIGLDFKPGRLFKDGRSTGFDIWIKKDELLLGTYAGDPDEAKALDFTKAK